MTVNEQRKAAEIFAETWLGRGNEKQETQEFWNTLLRDIFGIEKPEEYITFEKPVYVKGKKKYIDVYSKNSHIIIEQKSNGIDLLTPEQQSDGSLLTPFEQAWRYDGSLFYDEHCQYIITCNFQEFFIYDMNEEHKTSDPTYSFLLADLPTEYPKLQLLINQRDINFAKEEKVSKDAGIIVGKLYNALLKQYENQEDIQTLKALNALCVRIVFCLYAEDAGLFYSKSAFHDYLDSFHTSHMRLGLSELFAILNTEESRRSVNIEESLKKFPYVNGGLFEKEYEIPQFNEEIRHILLDEASLSFDWSEISPTIFGAVFESTLNKNKRREGGMHYTSVEYIHRVIDPLFLDGLKAELSAIYEYKQSYRRLQELRKFHDKLAKLAFLDPACGSGNFLTETYLSLRKMENEVIRMIKDEEGNTPGQMILGSDANPIKISLDQFYGIEIDDFAVTVATTALWISESQMIKETENIIDNTIKFFPLKSHANIYEKNALSIDWETVAPKNKLSYIIGNPPFVGKKYQSKDQKADMKAVFGEKTKGVGNLDYVTAWYRKAAEYIQNTNISVAFFSTNSLVQGEHIPLFWKPLYEKCVVNIIFAYPTFKWSSEATEKAAVHCVIIGFNAKANYTKHILFSETEPAREVSNIHPYLVEMPNILIENRSKPLFGSKPLIYGSFALDDGNYTISEDEYEMFIQREPNIEKYLKPFIGSDEFINGLKRYCIWLKDGDIQEIRSSHILDDRVRKVQKWRSERTRKETVAAAATPMLFAEIRQPDSDYMAIPITSSERREYIPIGYMTKDVIASNHLLVLPDATLYDFGVLTSSVHMEWMRVVAGRMKSDYNYSARIVYNNFPWIVPSQDCMKRIQETAQEILDVRALYTDLTYSDLYDPVYMPDKLRKAHKNNDKAVMDLYKFNITDSELTHVTQLMKMYNKHPDR